MQGLYLMIYLLMSLCGCCLTMMYDTKVCSRLKRVSYTQMVQRLRTITYRKRVFFIWKTKSRLETQYVPEVRLENHVKIQIAQGNISQVFPP